MPVAQASFFIPTASAATSETVTLSQLQENIDYLFPGSGYVTGLEYHSEWSEWDRGNMSEVSGIEVTYEAAFDLVPEQEDELPQINAYVIPMSSESAAEAQFDAWAESSNFADATWIKRTEGTDYFTYYTDSPTNNDLVKNRVLEEGSLHWVSMYNNVLIVVNFYRTSGDYLRSNVSAYLTYLENDEETLSVLNEIVIYIEEAMKFYVGGQYSIEGPSVYDYYVSSASYSVELSEAMEVPLNGTLSWDVYLDDGSEIGTLVDTAGGSTPATGTLSVSINESAVVDVAFYDPTTDSECNSVDGWHHLSGQTSLDLYDWQTVTIQYGVEGLGLWVNEELQGTCDVFTSRVATPVYLGDYPGDGTDESFVGYLKDFATTFGENEDGVLYDELAARMIFVDVSELHLYAEAIEYLKDEGIISGYGDGTFHPDQEVNRAEILKMLLLGFDYSVPENLSVPDLSDVSAGAWYLSYLNYALEMGVVQGYADGTYLPGNSLNRAEFLKILTRAYGLNLNDYPITGLYADTDIDAWYAPYVQYSKDNGLMDADVSGNFNPDATVSRGEVAETIYRLIQP